MRTLELRRFRTTFVRSPHPAIGSVPLLLLLLSLPLRSAVPGEATPAEAAPAAAERKAEPAPPDPAPGPAEAAPATPAVPGADSADPDERLLRAEILEVSSGDLTGAQTVYRELAADEAVPARVRARALLCLGRTQRKTGDLQAARSTLEDLVARYPEEREAVRQARGFLRELETRKPENPEFDWLAQMERSPEIQARVFDLAMDLADPNLEARARAGRQLLSLGTLALPVVERLIETSRDPVHRKHLAFIAVAAGRLERLDVLLGPGATRVEWGEKTDSTADAFEGYILGVPGVPDSERKRILDTLSKVEPAPENAWLATALRLAAGDRDGLDQKLAEMEGNWLFRTNLLLGVLIRHDRAVAESAARRIVDRAVSADLRWEYLSALLRRAPDLVGTAEWRAVLESLGPDSSWRLMGVRALETAGRFDLLEELAPRLPELIVRCFADAWCQPARGTDRLSAAPAGWAGVLSRIARTSDAKWAAEARALLHRFAEVQDAAVPALEELLRARGEVAPEYRGYGPREDRAWAPSAAYAEAMARLLRGDDPVTQRIALEALGLAPAGAGPEVLPEVERLLAASKDPFLRGVALSCLLSRLPGRPESGPAVIRAFLEDFELQVEDRMRPGASILGTTPNAYVSGHRTLGDRSLKVARRTSGQRVGGNEVAEFAMFTHAVRTYYVPSSVLERDPAALLEAARRFARTQRPGTDAADPTRFVEWLGDIVGPANAAAFVLGRIEEEAAPETRAALVPLADPKALWARLDLLKTPLERAALIRLTPEETFSEALRSAPGALDCVRSIALDPGLGTPEETRDRRVVAFRLAGERGLEWLDALDAEARQDAIRGLPSHVVAGRLDLLRSAEDRAAFLESLDLGGNLSQWLPPKPGALDLLRSAIQTRELGLEARRNALAAAGDRAASEWLDWPALLDGSDPLGVDLVLTGGPARRGLALRRRPGIACSVADRPADEVARIYRAALSGPRPEIREWAVASRPWEEGRLADTFEPALRDPSPPVRRAAVQRVAERALRDDAMLPVLLRLLDDPELAALPEVHEPLRDIASPTSLEPLAKLLDHRDPAVRKAALESLESIKGVLEKRDAWKELVKGIKKP